MELYVYETENGFIGDFRPYLDGRDHSFDDHRELGPGDPRWEKIRALRDPVYQTPLKEMRYVGRVSIRWHELIIFPIRWEGEFERDDWEPQVAVRPADP